MKIGNHEVHPAAEKITKYDALRFKLLVENIAAIGLLVRIVLFQGKVLDGRHRYRACIEAGVEPVFENLEDRPEFANLHPFDAVAAYNLQRRHNDDGQRALDARRLVKGKQDHDKQMRLMGVSDDCAAMADVVASEAVTELVEAVELGDVPLHVAAAIAKQDPEDQAELVERYQAAQEEVEPVRAVSSEKVVTSKAVQLPPRSIAALKALALLGDSSRHMEAKEGARVLRLIVEGLV